MTSDKKALAALVWKRVPADLKVAVSGTKLVSVGGKLVELGALSEAEMFKVLRTVNVVKTITKALEVA